MKAVVYDHYGPPDVLHVEEVQRPEPRDGDLLVRVHATTVTRSDAHIREANRSNGPVTMAMSRMISGWSRPRQPILGTELAGEVVAVGRAVDDFSVGDAVFGNTGFSAGCHAEFARVPASRAALKPANATFEEAAPTTDDR
jgi:NADPH:quinone reductase-like Zn-dependent oxidoreductase